MASSPIQGAGIQGMDRTNSPVRINMPHVVVVAAAAQGVRQQFIFLLIVVTTLSLIVDKMKPYKNSITTN